MEGEEKGAKERKNKQANKAKKHSVQIDGQTQATPVFCDLF